jgi:hypothetical protein
MSNHDIHDSCVHTHNVTIGVQIRALFETVLRPLGAQVSQSVACRTYVRLFKCSYHCSHSFVAWLCSAPRCWHDQVCRALGYGMYPLPLIDPIEEANYHAGYDHDHDGSNPHQNRRLQSTQSFTQTRGNTQAHTQVS